MISQSSLSSTVDAINAAAFFEQPIPLAERASSARWIASRHALPGAYAGTFAGFPSELAKGIQLFTGERVTNASARHILGEEASRALRALHVRDASVQAALSSANASLQECINRAALHPRNANPGQFCCPKCTVGMWRNLLSGGLDRQEERLRKGVGQALHSHRKGDNQWRTFPFWYTVLALSEMDFAEAKRELQYAAPVLERMTRRKAPSGVYAERRHALAKRSLERV